MDLFVMKRYVGANVGEQQRKEDHLSSLLTKIERRKKEREKVQLSIASPSLLKRKSKDNNEKKAEKRKSLSEDSLPISDVSTTSDDKGTLTDKVEPSHKKKKRRKKDLPEDNLTISVVSKTSDDKGKLTDKVEPSHEKKKRRKKDLPEKLQSNWCETDDVFYDVNENETSKESLPDDYNNEAAYEILPVSDRNEKSNDDPRTAYEDDTQIPGFTVIGSDNLKKRKKVQRVLPNWLANPFFMSRNLKDLKKSVNDIADLHPEIIKRLKDNNIEYFFPVQYEVIPWLLKAHSRPLQYRPNDICVSSPTGSGKTLAYILPIIQALKSRVMKHIRALVVLPVQELAKQIYLVFKEYSKGTDLQIMLFKGEKTVEQEQNKLVKTNIIIGQYNPVDIIVTTPKRLVYHIKHTPGFSLKYLRFLVIDEADIVIEHILDDWLYHVEKHIYGEVKGGPSPLNISSLRSVDLPPVQKLLFSATLTQNPEKLEQLKLFQPKLFTTVLEENIADNSLGGEIDGNFIGKYTTPAELTESYCVIDLSYKPLAVYLLLIQNNWKSVLCFTNSKESAHRLTILLKYLCKDDFKIKALSGNLRQGHRSQILRNFSLGYIDVLICSDTLARGIDLLNVDCVISYDAPKFIETYIHRTGRTGRAGNLGTAVTLLTNEEEVKFKNMLNAGGKQNHLNSISLGKSLFESKEEQYQEALEALRTYLERQKRAEERRNKSRPKKIFQRYQK